MKILHGCDDAHLFSFQTTKKKFAFNSKQTNFNFGRQDQRQREGYRSSGKTNVKVWDVV